MKKLLLNLLGVFAVVTTVNAQTTFYSESFEDTLGWTLSHKFDDGFEDYILHDSVAKINARTNGPDFTIQGADSAYVIAFEDINSGDNGSVSSGGFAELKIDSIPISGYDSLKVWLSVAANPTSNKYDNALNSFGNGDSMAVWASIDGGAYSRVMFFCAPDSNASKTSSSNTGSLYFDSNMNFIGGDANDVAVDDTLESFNSMVTGKGSYMSVRILLRTESGDEEIILDNFRVQGVMSSTCADPSGMVGAQLSTTSYSLAWTSVSSLSNIEYGAQGYTQGMGTMVNNVSSPYTLTGLMPGNSYDVYYQDTCTNIGTSNWVGPYTVTVSAAPSITNIWRTSNTNIMVAYSDSMQSLVATSTSRYKGIAGLSSVTLNSGADTATLNYSTPFADGVMNTLTVDSVLSASLTMLDTAYTFSFVYNGTTPDVVINEIMYNDRSGADTLEYIELYNAGTASATVGGMEFTSGINFIVPAGVMIPSGSYLVVAKNAAAHTAVFGNSLVAEWTSGGLSNGGETIEISNSDGTVIDMVSYDDGNGWPTDPDGSGYSLVLCDPTSDNTMAASWGVEPMMFSSSDYYASPGAANTCRPPFVPPLYSISVISTVDASTGVADSNGVKCSVKGLVASNQFSESGASGPDVQFALIEADNSAGVTAVSFSDSAALGYGPTLGDSIQAYGTLSQFRGLLQFNMDSVKLISQGNNVPAPLSIDTVAEIHESRLIKIMGVTVVDTAQWPAPGADANVDIVNGNGDTITMRIDRHTNTVDTWTDAPMGKFDVMGVGGQFSFNNIDGYQLLPRFASDIDTAMKLPCLAPMNLSTSDTTDEGATVNWTSSGMTWNVGWAEGHMSTMPTDSAMNITSMSYVITGLDTNTHYHAWVQQVCSDGTSEWTGPTMFKTLRFPLGIELVANKKALIAYPNPNNTGVLKLNKVSDIIIRNLLGQPVISQNATNEIDISDLTKGVYLIESVEGETFKLVVE